MSNDKYNLLNKIETQARKDGIPILQKETASILKIIVGIKKPKRILEIGTAVGFSAMLFSEYLAEDGYIDTVEIEAETADTAKKNIKEMELDNKINVFLADGCDFVANINKTYDMIFLDAAKSKYLDLFKDCMRILNIDGLLIADNVLYKGMITGVKDTPRKQRTIVRKMQQYIDIITNDKRLETCILDIGDGIAISRKVLKEINEKD